MDSPISKTGMHPYGRRVGTKERAGIEIQESVVMCAFVFIANQMYKLNRTIIICCSIFTK